MKKGEKVALIGFNDGNEIVYMRADDMKKASSLYGMVSEKMVNGEWVDTNLANFLEDIEDDQNATAWRIDDEEYSTYDEMIWNSWEDSYLLNGDGGYTLPKRYDIQEAKYLDLTFEEIGDDIVSFFIDKEGCETKMFVTNGDTLGSVDSYLMAA